MSHNIKSFFKSGIKALYTGLKMNCLIVLKERGINLSGYSPDTYAKLSDNDITDAEECESYLWFLEAVYG